MAWSAGDLMERHVLSVSPETPLVDVHRLFVEEEISGAPVIDNAGLLLGVISTTDLLRAVEEEQDTALVETDYFRDILPYSAPDWANAPEDFQNRLADRTVEEIMTRGVISVAPTATASEVARTLRKHRVHRVFVVEGGRMLGLISAFDVLRLIEETGA
jgi:CBS domain-containing protein